MIDNGFDSGRRSAEEIFDRARTKAKAEAQEWLSEQVEAVKRQSIEAVTEWFDRLPMNLTPAQKRDLKAMLHDRVRLEPTPD